MHTFLSGQFDMLHDQEECLDEDVCVSYSTQGVHTGSGQKGEGRGGKEDLEQEQWEKDRYGLWNEYEEEEY